MSTPQPHSQRGAPIQRVLSRRPRISPQKLPPSSTPNTRGPASQRSPSPSRHHRWVLHLLHLPAVPEVQHHPTASTPKKRVQWGIYPFNHHPIGPTPSKTAFPNTPRSFPPASPIPVKNAFSDKHPEHNIRAPRTYGGDSVSLG